MIAFSLAIFASVCALDDTDAQTRRQSRSVSSEGHDRLGGGDGNRPGRRYGDLGRDRGRRATSSGYLSGSPLGTWRGPPVGKSSITGQFRCGSRCTVFPWSRSDQYRWSRPAPGKSRSMMDPLSDCPERNLPNPNAVGFRYRRNTSPKRKCAGGSFWRRGRFQSYGPGLQHPASLGLRRGSGSVPQSRKVLGSPPRSIQ